MASVSYPFNFLPRQ